MPIKSDAARDIVAMHYGVDKEICTQYYGRDRLIYSSVAEQPLWDSETLNNLTYTRSGNSWFLGQNATYPPAFDIPHSFLQGPTTGTRYFLGSFSIGITDGTRSGLSSTRDGYATIRFNILEIPGDSSVHLLSSILSTNWKIKYKIGTGAEQELVIPGPTDTGNNFVSRTTTNFYTWIPNEAFQQAIVPVTRQIGLSVGTSEVVWQIPGPGQPSPPVIANFQCRQLPRGTLGKDITVNESGFPLQVQFSANITGADRWDFYRTGNAVPLASGLANVDLLHTVTLNDDFKPGSAGWSYNLVAKNTTLGNCGTRSDTVSVRSVRAPLINTFRASSPASSQGPFQHIVCSNLTGDVDVGDPPAQWNYSQSGKHITHLPSSRHAIQFPQRVCITSSDGTDTTLTLTGSNEGGTVSSSVTIDWPVI